MSSDPNTVELSFLRAFSPLDGLKNENLRALARKTVVRELAQGRLLFKEGDTDKRTYYLASGLVELLSNGKVVGTIRGGTPDARHPLAPILPRRCSARVASDKIEYLSIDSDLLDVLITWDQTGTYEVGELLNNPSADDWMTMLLQSRAFHRVPPANLQAVFMRMQRMSYAVGDVIVRQGDEGDFFYVVVRGKCSVTCENTSLPKFIQTSCETVPRRVANRCQVFQIETKHTHELFKSNHTVNALPLLNVRTTMTGFINLIFGLQRYR